MRLKIYQAGAPVLRKRACLLSVEEIKSPPIQQLIELMRETMRDAPGVGLAAPQVGESLQIAVIEDSSERINGLPDDIRDDRECAPVPFHVIINPVLTFEQSTPVSFFEGCLSIAGYAAVVPRAHFVRVECLNEDGDSQVIKAQGWYARILQHEIDHLHGTLYVDRMNTRSFMTQENYLKNWHTKTSAEIETSLHADHS